MITVRIQTDDFNSGAELALIEDGVGAVSSFTGIVRGQGGLISLTLEHYPAMTEQVLAALADEAATRWSLAHVTLIHRVGPLYPSDRIVFVATASAHRAAALESCAFLIDSLKTDAPFWKKESFADGRETWVDARESDAHAADRWR
ncbi:MAG: molybdenum cofactor biosynthesis protein MoaE [Chakrabartia sp.]